MTAYNTCDGDGDCLNGARCSDATSTYMQTELNITPVKSCVCPGTLYDNGKCIINRNYSMFKIKKIIRLILSKICDNL